MWNKKINIVLLEAEFKPSKEDRCLYVKDYGNDSLIYILIYVDDLIVACKTQEHFSYVETILSAHFELKNPGPIKEFFTFGS